MLATGLYLLGYARAASNIYAFWFAAAALVVLGLLGVASRLLALKLHFTIVSWQARNLKARHETEHTIGLSPSPAIPLFRMHFAIEGVFECGNKVRLKVKSESAADRDGVCLVPMYFPLCGVLHANGRLYLRDVLGFIRIPLQPSIAKVVYVKPPLFPVPEALRVDVTSSPEPSRKQQQSDEEKYYMREYEPGDRMKDVNWKASFRVYEMITRISPVSPEPSRLLRLELRPFSSQGETPLTLMHLNYAKSWLLSFISAIQTKHPQYRFHVRAGTHEAMIEDGKDIETLAQVLCDVHFQSEALQPDKRNDEVFIFTTAFDQGLAGYLGLRSLAKTHLFKTSGPGQDKKETRRVRLFHLAPGLALPPLRGFPAFIRSASQRKIPVSPGRANGFYMEEKLKLAII
ncbi:MAG: DUF58 domain-containing protein [Leptospirales bacterium]|nr:DUF58 domain-containing protein [Leptospirales bacterium]